MLKENIVVDLIIADPPYVISRKSQFHTMKDRKNPRTGTDFGEWDKEFDNKSWLLESYKLLKPGGSLILFNSFTKSSDIIRCAESCGYIYKDTLIWHKTNPMPRNRERRYAPNIEMIIWFVKSGDKWTFNRQIEPYESCILSYPSESGGGFKRYHPTQKPLKLIKHLLLVHSNEYDLVLDPFMGSGTSVIACIEENRNFIGFEINKDYYNIATQRIATESRN